MSIFFSLKTSRPYGLAYHKEHIATLFLVTLLVDADDYDHFLYEYWFTYFHEYLHLFFHREIGRFGYAEKTIDRIVSRLLLFYPIELGVANSIDNFFDVAMLLPSHDKSWSFSGRAVYAYYALKEGRKRQQK